MITKEVLHKAALFLESKNVHATTISQLTLKRVCELLIEYATLSVKEENEKGAVSEWQLCPKCLGEGQIECALNAYGGRLTSSGVWKPCPCCNGAKMLVKPILPLPPSPKAEKG